MNDSDPAGPYGVPGGGEPNTNPPQAPVYGPQPPLNAPQPVPAPPTAAGPERKSGLRRLFSRKRNVVIAGAVAVCVAAGVSIGAAASSSSSSTTASSSPTTAASGPAFPIAGASGAAGGGANARSGPAAGGTSGTVTSVSGTSFTVTTTDGQKVTVNESSSTTYQNGSSATTASAITTNTPVLVLGTVNSTTISAAQVTIEPANSPYTTTSSAVVPFQRGSQSAAKTVGAVPANYTEGQGTIVSGTTAYQAAQAALAQYPGVVVDRVVQLSNGEYEVHTIGANWPHHVFVSTTFQVLGAD